MTQLSISLDLGGKNERQKIVSNRPLAKVTEKETGAGLFFIARRQEANINAQDVAFEGRYGSRLHTSLSMSA